MEGIRQYLISITAVALICSTVKCLFDEKTASGAVIRLTSGLILALTVLSPLIEIRLSDLPALTDSWSAEAQDAVQTGKDLAQTEAQAIINQRLEAYILDKADAWDVSLSVSFRDYGDNMLPNQVILQGSVSPYAKTRLQQIISMDLGIPKENQVWIG